MITSWDGLMIELTRLIDGEDVSVSTISPGTLTQMVYMAELRIYRDLRCRHNEKDWGITTTANTVALPADFTYSSLVTFGKEPLEPKPEKFLLSYLNQQQGGGPPLYFCEAGGYLKFAPLVADGTTLQGRYFYKLPQLTPSSLPSNALFAAAEDLFVYGALAESAPFFGQDARIPLWESKFASVLNHLNSMRKTTAYSAGLIRVRPSTKLMR